MEKNLAGVGCGIVRIYYITGPDNCESEIKLQDDEMIVYDVCKIKDYQGNDYVPRAAKKMDYHMLKEMFYPKEEESDGD